MKRLAKILLTLTALFLYAAPAHAAAETPAGKFVGNLGNNVLQTLANKSTTPEQVRETFRTMLHENFDLPAIGRFVLGRSWRTATPEQQTEYLQLFNKMVEQIYVDRFSLYSGETFEIIDTHGDDASDKIVSSRINRPNGPAVNVDWRVKTDDKGKMTITDVIVEGVSMAVTQRAEFASVIQRNGGNLDGLLQALRDKTAVKDNATATVATKG